MFSRPLSSENRPLLTYCALPVHPCPYGAASPTPQSNAASRWGLDPSAHLETYHPSSTYLNCHPSGMLLFQSPTLSAVINGSRLGLAAASSLVNTTAPPYACSCPPAASIRPLSCPEDVAIQRRSYQTATSTTSTSSTTTTSNSTSTSTSTSTAARKTRRMAADEKARPQRPNVAWFPLSYKDAAYQWVCLVVFELPFAFSSIVADIVPPASGQVYRRHLPNETSSPTSPTSKRLPRQRPIPPTALTPTAHEYGARRWSPSRARTAN